MTENQLRITGFAHNPKTVSLIQAVRDATTLSLPAAKEYVERVLAGQRVVLDLAPHATPGDAAARLRELGAVVEDVGDTSLAWELWRQDDNGNRLVIRSFASRADAEQEAERMDALGHKQLYWVQRAQ